ncbi:MULTISPECIES: tautomerase family protein [Streptomyces]|uniref:Tautomerase family protein n=1 Tax=Streptomyces sudanensis TaxID=436397 RepID=A0ABY4TEF3_9ACTN|nr:MULTISPECIES: tautomerase family protein [Streptomyces]MCP9956849.1 tautomerase family protein [Streptomyces sudanensis]MCP9986045.1 tautomerase family protein [Streptomyces sudanensis]MCQ0002569.1 tautomerase family protein [Streptomyces sudanensis]URN17322.1 tautomerase family protein [Streptomyces sudanensis]
MPHVSVKHWPRTFTDAEKARLVTELTETITGVFGCDPGSLSIAVEAVEPSRWTDEVHVPEIEGRTHLLWKRPNYTQPIPTDPTPEGTR